MPAGADEIYRSIRFDLDGADFSKWPKLSCSAANELTLATPPTEDDPNPGVARLAITGELKLQAGVAVNELSSDGKLTNNSDLAIPTQKAVKTYVDAQIGQVNQSLSVKAALAGASSQDFQTKNLTVSGYLSTTGNIGIGTIPKEIFAGSGSSKVATPLTIKATGVSQGLITFEDPNGVPIWHINQRLGGNNSGLNFAETSVADGRLFIQAGGNVGIGTASPTEKLHVTGGGIKVGATTIATPGIEVLREVLPLALATDNSFVDINDNGAWTPITRTIYSVFSVTTPLPGSQRKYKLVIRNGNNGIPQSHKSKYRLFFTWANQSDNKEYEGNLYWGSVDEGGWETITLDHLANPSGQISYWRLEGYTSGCANRIFNVTIQVVDVIQ